MQFSSQILTPMPTLSLLQVIILLQWSL